MPGANSIILLSGLLKEDEDATLQSGIKNHLIQKEKWRWRAGLAANNAIN